MHSTILAITLLTLACLLVQGAVNATPVLQTGCYKSNVILDCTHYSEHKPGVPDMDLRWYAIDKSSKRVAKLARIDKSGEQKLFRSKKNQHFMDRLILHRNGSLEISSFHPDDEGLYRCAVMQGKFSKTTYQIQLSVACGKVTEIKREVCVEEDVVLDCDAMHRVEPSKRKPVSWKKKTALENGSSYSRVDPKGGFLVHENGSLLLPKGRQQGKHTYKCQVKKTDGSSKDEHIIEAISRKCYKETPQPATEKPPTTIPSRKATIKDVPSIQETSICGGVFNNPIGAFQSPNYPSSYPANSRCQWTISVPQDYSAINITFDHVNIEHEDSCQNDYITIHDQLGNQIGCRICGTRNSPRQLQVKGEVAVVIFHSDTSVNKSGFKINYKAVQTA